MKNTAKAVPVTIGPDSAKSFFQLHAVDAAGQVVLRRKLSRGEVLRFFEVQPKTLVGIEACGGVRGSHPRQTAPGKSGAVLIGQPGNSSFHLVDAGRWSASRGPLQRTRRSGARPAHRSCRPHPRPTHSG